MGEVHRLLDEKGRVSLLADPCLPFDRAVVEAASSYLTCEAKEIGYLYSGWAQSALPHKRLADDASWQVRTDYVSLLVEPGKRHTLTGDPIPIGVPYGSRARLIILYLQSEAMRTSSREIELGRSLHAWLRKLEISVGGSSMAAVRDQAERISRCRMSFQIKQGNRTGLINQNILDTAMFVDADGDGSRGALFAETVKLSEMFFEQLKRHPVPIEESAIKSISNNSQAIDIYCFLAYRLHALSAPTMVPWKSLMAQFGAGVSALFKFRQQFRATLELAMAVYPEAKVEVLPRGVMLHPSPPPVSPKIFPLAPRHKAQDFCT